MIHNHIFFSIVIFSLFLGCALSKKPDEAVNGNNTEPLARLGPKTCNLDVCFVIGQSCLMPRDDVFSSIEKTVKELTKDGYTSAHYSTFGFSEIAPVSQKRVSRQEQFLKAINSPLDNEQFESFQKALRNCFAGLVGDKQRVVVITDGFKSFAPLPTPAGALGSHKLPSSGGGFELLELKTFSIAVGEPENENYLEALASQPEYYKKVPSLKALNLARELASDLSCPQESCPIDHVCFAMDKSGSIASND